MAPRHITATTLDGVVCIRLKHSRLEETEIHQLGEEILAACAEPGSRLALSLGPETPYCLYSVFLAKLVAIRNALARHGGTMVLCEVGPNAYSTFEACHLKQEFIFVKDFAAAVAHFAAQARG
ncbi:MAG: hypothetical protein U0840_23950 [Gemmataceae bacterium]